MLFIVKSHYCILHPKNLGTKYTSKQRERKRTKTLLSKNLVCEYFHRSDLKKNT